MMKTVEQMVQSTNRFPTKVIQFGEGNFLRAFVDWQIQQMNNQGLFEGGVAIVQPIDRGLVKMLAEQGNYYTVLLEGLMNGEEIQSDEIITCVNETIDPYEDYEAYLALADIETVEVIFSNTTEAGIAFDATDVAGNQPPKTYPGKLTALLYRRFQNGLNGFHLIPCELINHGGQKLKETILHYVELWNLEPEFKDWLETDNYFYSTLVDRIVPGYPRDDAEAIFERIGYRDNLLVKAEPFLLFVIEGDQKLAEVLPLAQAGLNVIITDDMRPYRERKVRLLNGPHTTMTPVGLLAGLETVGEVMADADFAQYINDEMYQEIAPMIDLPEAELADYIEAVKERFANPFVHHELKAIALNSISKFKTRLLPTLQQYMEVKQTVPERVVLSLAALLVIYGDFADITVEPVDTPEIIAEFQALAKQEDYVTAVLANTDFWEQDMTAYPELVTLVKTYVARLAIGESRAIVQELNQA